MTQDVQLPDAVIARAADALGAAYDRNEGLTEEEVARTVLEAAMGEVVSSPSDRWTVLAGMKDMADQGARLELERDEARAEVERLREALRQIEAHSPLRTFGFSARQLGVMAREALEGDAPL